MKTDSDHNVERYWPRIPYGDRVTKPDYTGDCLPAQMGNPFFRALPPPRSLEQVFALIERPNPKFDPAIREASFQLRLRAIDDVGGAIFAMRRHVRLEEQVMTTILNAYRWRPFSHDYVKNVIASARAIDLGSPPPPVSCGDTVGSGSLVADPGQGKTRSLERILLSCPQIIEHPEFNGRYLGVTQVPWLCLSMPEKASASGLYLAIAAMLDDLLKTNYRVLVQRAKNGPAKLQQVVEALGINAVGAIFLDEGQNMAIGPVDRRLEMESALMKLINHTHTRFVMVATKRPREFIQSEALLRRMVGERGSIIWTALEGPAWQEFLERLWARQVTCIYTPIDKVLADVMHILAGGSPFYAKQLFTAVQSSLIRNGNGDERITPLRLAAVCREAFEDRFGEAEPVLRTYLAANPALRRAAEAAP